ncbi:MAG TPA: PmoA family protein [Puia sp.]|nr:PmoA family protein [Puia sp.]
MKIALLLIIAGLLNLQTLAQKEIIHLASLPAEHKVIVKAGDQAFTVFTYPDTLEKPVLYPIYAADGELITRGFPAAPRPGDPADHPHHIGLWMNYENVNGLDFWNNSFAIPADKKNAYGWIRSVQVLKAEGGVKGILIYQAKWTDQGKNPLLDENTTFIFRAEGSTRIIDRISTLQAEKDVLFKDAKDGFLGLRVAHELELPSKDARQYVDDKGNITQVAATQNSGVTGNYLTSEGKTGDSAWGTRARWCMLYGKRGADTVSVVIVDNRSNPGYPTYWHARGYGLFAANPLGQKIFSGGQRELNYKLAKGESVTFKYRVIITSRNHRLSPNEIDQLSGDF